MSDPVHKPEHYQGNGMECIDALRAGSTPAEFRGHCKLTAVAYIWREAGKGGDEDLRKAIAYLQFALDASEPRFQAGINGRLLRAQDMRPGAMITSCAHDVGIMLPCKECESTRAAGQRVRTILKQREG